jgi:D-alanine-D-alanine ligase
MRVALLHNLRPEFLPPGPDDAYEEYDTPQTIAAVAAALRALAVTVEPVEAGPDLAVRLGSGRFDFAFNIAEGRGRRCREGIPAAICELLDLPYTGSDMLTLAVALDKAAARRLVSPEVPIARAVLLEDGIAEPDLASLNFPVVVKPNDEGSSKGIRGDAVALDPATAVRRARQLHGQYKCPVLVEEFLSGAEVTVGVVGNGRERRLLGMMEIAPLQPEPHWIYSLEVKRDFRRRVRYHLPPRLDATTLATIESHALTACRLLGCRDLARLDFRLDARGAPHFLECNPLPGLNPDTGDLPILSRERISYEELVQGVLLDAARRLNVPLNVRQPAIAAVHHDSTVAVAMAK